MFSLNVPVPREVDQFSNEIHPQLAAFDRIRDRHSLCLKRFGADDVNGPGGPTPEKERTLAELRERLRPLLAGTGPFDVQLPEIDYFENPTKGTAPVVYFAVESDVLRRLHRRLCAAFDPIEGLEGDDYTPHVTLARGGDVADAEALAAMDFDPIEWRVHALDIFDPDFREPAASLEL